MSSNRDTRLPVCPGSGPAASERPRELLERMGAEHLPLSKLLALLLGSGCAAQSAERSAQSLVERYGSLRALDKATAAELRSVRGIGAARAGQLKAALELGKRLIRERAPVERSITRPSHALRYVGAYYGPYLRDAQREHFCVILLNRRNRPIRNVELTRGSVSASVVDPKDVVREGLLAAASAILLVHNHPSGDADPSPEDIRITAEVDTVCRAVGLELLDHVIVGRSLTSLFSFRDAGLVK
jgi:DNA repair protein RadC